MNTSLPVHLKHAALCALVMSAVPCARADDAADCRAAAGTYLTGVVQSAPTFQDGKSLRGVVLSHTHLPLLDDADAKTYDIAIDNVFASGYLRHQDTVPPPLDMIRKGDHLELCGISYQGGMHWVHTNCGDPPTPQDPDGWVRELAADGMAGANLEGSTTYCYLWPKKQAARPAASR